MYCSCAHYLVSIHLQRLSGVFEVKIYPSEFSVSSIKAACLRNQESEVWPPTDPYDLRNFDLRALSQTLDRMDRTNIRKRKAIYSRLYQEAFISHQPGVGISFTDMLELLAHHKLIVDAEALV